MKNIIILVGQCATGKTSLEKELYNRFLIKRAISFTTRPRRVNERDGDDYFYISKETFLKLKNDGFFYETTSYSVNGDIWYYGLGKEKSLIKDKYCVVTINPEGLNAILKYPEIKNNSIVFYLNSSIATRMYRYLKRENFDVQAYINMLQRFERDKKDFENDLFLKDVEYIKIQNEMNDSLEELSAQIMRIMIEENNN